MPDQFLGSQSYTSIQEETTYKTDPAAPSMEKIYFLRNTIRLSRDLISSETIRGNRNPTPPIQGNKNVAGDLATELMATSDILFRGLLGSATSSSPNYTHTIKVGSKLPSFVIERGFTDPILTSQYFKYNGCKINSATFTVSPTGYVEVVYSIIGAKETVSTTPFDSTLTEYSKVSFTGSMISSSDILEGGVAIGTVISIDGLTIENNLDDSVYVIGGDGERAALPAGLVRVGGTLNAMFADMTLYNKAISSPPTESSLKIKYTYDVSNTCEILIPELIYTPNAPVVEGPGGVQVSLPFEAYYDNSAAASAIQITIRNTVNRGWV